MHLAAVVRLVIEEMAEHDAERRAEPLARRAEVIEREVEPSAIEPLDHADQAIVFRDARGLERREVAVEDLVECELLGPPLDAAEPDAVPHHEMVESGVDRAEEARTRLQVLDFGKLGAGGIEPGVGPGVVAGKGAEIAIGHRASSPGYSTLSEGPARG